MSKLSILLKRAGIAALACGAAAACLAGTAYQVTDIGSSLPAGSLPYPRAINDAGQVVGTYDDATGLTRGFYFDGVSTRDMAPEFAGKNIRPSDISNRGKVIGTVDDAETQGGSEAFTWTDGQAIKISSSKGDNQRDGVAISRSGRELFWRNAPCNGLQTSQLVLLQKGKNLILPSTTGGCGHFTGYASVNDMGWVGGTESSYSASHAILFNGSETLDLHNRLGFAGCCSYVNDINDRGDIIGYIGFSSVYIHNIESGALATFDIGQHWLQSINDKGVAVGRAETYSRAEGFRDVNSLLAPGSQGWVVRTLTGINNRGALIGMAIRNGNQDDWHAVLLTPKGAASK